MNYYKTICFLLLSTWSMNGQELVEFMGATTNYSTKKQLVEATLFFKIKDGYHIQSEKAHLYDFISTEISFENNDSTEIISSEIISKNNKVLSENEYAQDILIDAFEVVLYIKRKDAADLDPSLKGSLDYQACSDKQCLFPRTLSFQVENLLNNYKSSK